MTKKRPLILAVLFAILAIVTVYASGRYSAQLLTGNNKGGTVGCSSHHVALHVTIRNGAATPDMTTGNLCDTLTITNQDPIDREIAFGPHEDHVPYDGIAERLLEQGQSLTVTLNQVGTFHFHDHIHDEVQGYFTVQK